MLGLGLGLAFAGAISPIAGSAYDYLITNDAEWATIPAGLLSGGGVVAVAPGTYTAKTLTGLSPSAYLRIEAQIPASKPRIGGNGLTINDCNKIWLKQLECVSTRWDGTLGQAIDLTGTCDDILIDSCVLRGNYRGDPDFNFDVTVDTYPEYACILPVFNAGGVITSFVIERPTVGDLMADGTYNMVFAGSITGAAATFTVTSGQIVSTSLTTGGTSAFSNTTGIGIRSALITWTGQRRIINWMPSGVRSSTGGSALSNIACVDCTFELCNSGFKPANVVGAVTFTGNTLRKIYQDFFSVGLNGTQTPYAVTHKWNFGTLGFSKSGDPGDPHADFIQFFMDDIAPDLTPSDWAVTVRGNIYIDGTTRGGIQGAIFGDTPPGVYYIADFAGNFIASKRLMLAAGFDGMRDCLVYRNAIVRYDPTDTTNNTAAYNVQVPASGVSGAVGTSFVAANIFELLSVGDADADVDTTTVTNAVLGYNGATVTYDAAFASPTAARTTIAEIVAAYTPEAAHAGRGPFASSSWMNHSTRTETLSLEPTFVRFADLTSQALSTVVSSAWQKMIGGPATVAISVSSGLEWRQADDTSGTNATSWSAASGTVTRGKFLQLRMTTSASGSTATTKTVTLGSTARDWTVTTIASAFTAADNQATAYSSLASTVSSDTNVKRVVIAVRVKPDAIVANANILASAAASTMRLYFPTTGAFRLTFIQGTRVNLRPTLTPDTTARTHFITLDFTNTNASQGCKWATDVDGTLLNDTPGAGGTFDTRSVAGSGADYGAYAGAAMNTDVFLSGLGILGEADGGGVLLDGRIEMFLMDWGDNTYTLPDILNSSVRAQATRDTIGDGTNLLGHQAKLCYWDDSVANWNSGLTNRGSISKTLTKGAGTYV